jgi:regulator of protease activity HflC (stomatin/prohibitin superfamily)
MIILLILGLLILLISLYLGAHIVPQEQVWIVQRLGKFCRRLEPGPNWIVPFIDDVAYRHSLKEEAIDVPEQTAITQDNVSVVLDGIVYVKIVDPFAASYGVKNPLFALTQLVQTTMRSEIGKIPLDKAFEERESLNAKMVEAVNQAALSWGIRCLRYEVKDIKMPEDIRKAMELQMTAERQKRARILESEGLRQSHINDSEGQRQAAINIAEGKQVDTVHKAKGEAEAIDLLSAAAAKGIERIARALAEPNGDKAAALQVAEKYIEAFSRLAKEGNTIVIPSNLQHPAAMVAEAMGIYDKVKRPSHFLESVKKTSNS